MVDHNKKRLKVFIAFTGICFTFIYYLLTTGKLAPTAKNYNRHSTSLKNEETRNTYNTPTTSMKEKHRQMNINSIA